MSFTKINKQPSPEFREGCQELEREGQGLARTPSAAVVVPESRGPPSSPHTQAEQERKNLPEAYQLKAGNWRQESGRAGSEGRAWQPGAGGLPGDPHPAAREPLTPSLVHAPNTRDLPISADGDTARMGGRWRLQLSEAARPTREHQLTRRRSVRWAGPAAIPDSSAAISPAQRLAPGGRVAPGQPWTPAQGT